MAINVLVTDDSLVMRAMIAKTLHMTGLPVGEIYEASNGVEGLKVLEEHWVDLVLVDINMPVMTGEEMLEKMRQNPDTAETPVIVVSSEGSQARIERLEQKASSFIQKPFTAETVCEVVKSITGVRDESGT